VVQERILAKIYPVLEKKFHVYALKSDTACAVIMQML